MVEVPPRGEPRFERLLEGVKQPVRASGSAGIAHALPGARSGRGSFQRDRHFASLA